MPWATNPSCVPFSGEMSGSTDIIIPIPMNDTDATTSTTNAGKYLASGIERSKKTNAQTTKRKIARRSP